MSAHGLAAGRRLPGGLTDYLAPVGRGARAHPCRRVPRRFPLALLAFAAGVVLLQWQPALPPVLPWIGAAAVAAAGGVGARALAGRSPVAWGIAMVLAALTAGALGFGYAAWRAEARLADALPPEWEGEDIALVGVVDELPQRSDRGTRFAFAVERIETAGAIVPGRLSLAWYAQWQKGGAERSGSGPRRRRALAARRPAEAAARHRQPARLRRRGVAAGERAAGDRLCARRRAQRAARCVRRPRVGLRAAGPGRHPRAHRRRVAGRALRGRDRRADDRRAARDSRSAMGRVQPDRHRAPDQHLGAARHRVRRARGRSRLSRSPGGAWR